MDPQLIIQRERQASRAIIYMSNVERIIQKDLLTKQKQSHKQKINACSPKGKGGGRGIKQEFGINQYLPHKINKRGPTVKHKELCSTSYNDP